MSDHLGVSDPNEIYRTIAKRDGKELNAELAGLEIGRIERFIPTQIREETDNTRSQKARDRAYHDLLTTLLLTDPAYAALYVEVAEKIEDTFKAIDKALRSLDQQIHGLNAQLDDIDDRAHQLPDGTKVFLSEDGNAYTEDGRKLTDEERDSIDWDQNAPSYEEYKRTQRALQEAERRKREIEEYRDNVVKPSQGRLNDRENPPSPEELEEIKKRLDEQRPEYLNKFVPPSHDVSEQSLSQNFDQRVVREDTSPPDLPPDLGPPAFGSIPTFDTPPANNGAAVP